MSMKTVRRVAAGILNCGYNRVKILDQKRAKEALTREDVKALIKDKAIVRVEKRGISRGRARAKRGKRTGRMRGSRKGSKFAGFTAKDRWKRKVRAQRRVIKAHKGRLSNADYRSFYRMIKGNAFKGKKQLLQHVQEKLLKKQV